MWMIFLIGWGSDWDILICTYRNDFALKNLLSECHLSRGVSPFSLILSLSLLLSLLYSLFPFCFIIFLTVTHILGFDYFLTHLLYLPS